MLNLCKNDFQTKLSLSLFRTIKVKKCGNNFADSCEERETKNNCPLSALCFQL